MERHRPTIVLIVAILHFVGGGLGVMGVGVGGVQLAMKGDMENRAPPPGQQERIQFEMEKKLYTEVPGWRIYEISDLVSTAVFTGMVFLAGFGLLQMKPWGRSLTILYAVLRLIYAAGTAAFLLAFVVPVVNSGMEDIVRSMPEFKGQDIKTMTTIMQYSMTGVFCCIPGVMVIYPIFALTVMLWPSVARAFREPAAPDRPAPEEDYADFDRDRDYNQGYE